MIDLTRCFKNQLSVQLGAQPLDLHRLLVHLEEHSQRSVNQQPHQELQRSGNQLWELRPHLEQQRGSLAVFLVHLLQLLELVVHARAAPALARAELENLPHAADVRLVEELEDRWWRRFLEVPSPHFLADHSAPWPWLDVESDSMMSVSG